MLSIKNTYIKFLLICLIIALPSNNSIKGMHITESLEITIETCAYLGSIASAGILTYFTSSNKNDNYTLKKFSDQLKFSKPVIIPNIKISKEVKAKIDSLPFSTASMLQGNNNSTIEKALASGLSIKLVDFKELNQEILSSTNPSTTNSNVNTIDELHTQNNQKQINNTPCSYNSLNKVLDHDDNIVKIQTFEKITSIFRNLKYEYPQNWENWEIRKYNFNSSPSHDSHFEFKISNSAKLALVKMSIDQFIKFFTDPGVKKSVRDKFEYLLSKMPELKKLHYETINETIDLVCKMQNSKNVNPEKRQFLSQFYENLLLLNNLNQKLKSSKWHVLGVKADNLDTLVRSLNSIFLDSNGNLKNSYHISGQDKIHGIILSYIKSVSSDQDHYTSLLKRASHINSDFNEELDKLKNNDFQLDYNNSYLTCFLENIIPNDWLKSGVSSEEVLSNANNQISLNIIHLCSNQFFSTHENMFFNKAIELSQEISKDNHHMQLVVKNIIQRSKAEYTKIKAIVIKKLLEDKEFKAKTQHNQQEAIILGNNNSINLKHAVPTDKNHRSTTPLSQELEKSTNINRGQKYKNTTISNLKNKDFLQKSKMHAVYQKNIKNLIQILKSRKDPKEQYYFNLYTSQRNLNFYAQLYKNINEYVNQLESTNKCVGGGTDIDKTIKIPGPCMPGAGSNDNIPKGEIIGPETDIKIGETYASPGSIIDDAPKCGTGKVNNFPEGITECNFSKRARYGHVVRVPIVDNPAPGPGQDPDNEVSDSAGIGQANNPGQEIIEEDAEAVSEVKSGFGPKEIISEGDCSKAKDKSKAKSEIKIGDCEHCGSDNVNIEKDHLVRDKNISIQKEKKILEKDLIEVACKGKGYEIASSIYKIKRMEHIFSIEILCEKNIKTGKKEYKVKGGHYLSDKLKNNPNIKIEKTKEYPCGCSQAMISYKNSQPKEKSMFPAGSTPKEVFEWIIESLNNPIETKSLKRGKGERVVGFANINGVKVKIITALRPSKNGFGIESSYPDLENYEYPN